MYPYIDGLTGEGVGMGILWAILDVLAFVIKGLLKLLDLGLKNQDELNSKMNRSSPMDDKYEQHYW